MVAAGDHHQQHVPPLQLNGVPARLPASPRAVPARTATWYSSDKQRKLLRWHPEVSLLSGGNTSGWVATSQWGSWAPLPTLATMTLPGVTGWRSPT